jgi:hypothetical protein
VNPRANPGDEKKPPFHFHRQMEFSTRNALQSNSSVAILGKLQPEAMQVKG